MKPKVLVASIATALIASSAAVVLLYIAVIGLEKIASQSFRFALTCALGFSLIRGWNPGRWITMILLGVAVIASLIAAVSASDAGGSWFFPTVLSVFHLVCLIGLLTPLAGRHFSEDRPRAPYRELPSQELIDVIQKKSDEALLEMFTNNKSWKPVALEVARKELKSRGIVQSVSV